MSSTAEKNFSGFVKMVIGATGLVAMGAIVAGGSLLKGLREGAKNVRNAEKDSNEKSSDHTESTKTPAVTTTEAVKDIPIIEQSVEEKISESDSPNTQ